MNIRPCLALLAAATAGLAIPSNAQTPPAIGARAAQRVTQRSFDRVLHDDPGTAVHWASGDDWKASFGRDGFTFIPYLGADAERNYPVAFRLAGVRVGGRAVPVDLGAAPVHRGDRVTFDRGAIHEIYELSLRQVEQRFVLDTDLAGDVDVELRVATELTENAEEPGLQWGNARGGVAYGEAFLVRGGERMPIESIWNGTTIRLHVPAYLRGAGPVVIDPIATTFLTGFSPTFPQPTVAPDIAFDVTGNVYMAVWEARFSLTDIDVYGEMFDGDGNLIMGSGAAFDFTSLSYSQPAIGDCNAANRFLVVMAKSDPALFQGRSMIVGRTRDANFAAPVTPEFLISDPNWSGSGHHTEPDVGGDSGVIASAIGWVVVWTYTTAAGNSAVHRRFYGPNTVATGPDLQLLGGPVPLYSPKVSSSNGRGHVPDPGWLVVMSQSNSATDVDARGMLLSTSGATGAFVDVDNDFDDDRYPSVSSPITNAQGNRTYFLVTYEQQSPAAAKAVVYDATTHTRRGVTDLTQAFGFGPFWLRTESDGLRFAVTATSSPSSTNIGVGTLAFSGQSLVLHENLRTLPGTASYPRLTSKYAGGGPNTAYAVAYVDGSPTPSRTRVAFYNGYQPGVQIAQYTLACNGLGLQWAGLPLLGQTMQFTLSSFGNDLPAIGFGFASATPIPLCPSCSLGLRPDLPIQVTFGSMLTIAIPPNIALVGSTYAIQGLSFGQGSCLGSLSFSDMFEITVR